MRFYLFLVFYFFCTISLVRGQSTFKKDQILVRALIRDFWPANSDHTCKDQSDCGHEGLPSNERFNCKSTNCHRDFECYAGSGIDGALEDTLDEDGKPVLKPQFAGGDCDSKTSNWHSVEEFAQWYRDNSYNIPINVNLTFENSQENPDIYSYSSSSFFPINHEGYGDYYEKKNFAFTTEVKARFQYQGGEVFTFTGDDDLWVFINGKLALDLGGLHASKTKTLYVDTLGLTKGDNYPFTIFHAERHTTASNFNAYTSLILYCSYIDHCGVCQGDGQTCCTCDDSDPCTKDSCAIMNSTCSFTPIVCEDDNNVCTINYCDSNVPGDFTPATHCKVRDLNCDDDNECTTDSCDPKNGCTHVSVDCDDDNKCTFDHCDAKTGCYHTENTCDDGDPCTIDNCDPKLGCSHVKMNCDDKDGCTTDTCVDGTCQHIKGDPDTNPYCATQDNPCLIIVSCVNETDPSTCTTAPKNCSDPDACHTGRCNIANGGTCEYDEVICDDGNACTDDYCDPVEGCKSQVHQCTTNDPCFPATCDPISGCGNTTYNCDDGNVCTTDSCSNVDGNAACAHEYISVDDGNLCTNDFCNAQTGIYHENVTCDDNNACTTDSCDPSIGCVYTPVEIPSGDQCVTSYCDKNLGIISSEATCRSGCTCDKVKGCICSDTSFWEKPETQALGGTAIALIVLGAAVGVALLAFGGKKGFDYYRKGANSNFTVQENPMYESNTNNVENPLYEG